MVTRDLVAQLSALAKALDARLTIINVIVDEQGRTIATFRKTVVVPKEDR